MSQPRVVPYGSWKSPITSDLIVSGSIGLSQPMMDGSDLYWIEMRPTEGGRNVIVRREASGETLDINPVPLNARTRVHQYGGGGCAGPDKTSLFSHSSDQRVLGWIRVTPPTQTTPIACILYSHPI